MKIGMHNYEEWMLSYIDGELDGVEQMELKDFLREHPDLVAELELLQSLKLSPEKATVFPDKSSLYRRDVRIIPLYRRTWAWAAAAAMGVLVVLIFIRHPLIPVTSQIARIHPLNGKLNPDNLHPVSRGKASTGKLAAAAPGKINPGSTKHPVTLLAAIQPSIRTRPAQEAELLNSDSSKAFLAKHEEDAGIFPPLRAELTVIPIGYSEGGIRLNLDLVIRNGIFSLIPEQPAGQPDDELLATIQGSAGNKLVVTAAKLEKFFARKPPLLSKNEILQVGHIEVEKINQ